MFDYRHLYRMTDAHGMLQFSKLSEPDPASGYTLDDNARALIVAVHMEDGHQLAVTYASWLNQAQRYDGTWSNLQALGHDIRALDSEDSVGRALLACAIGMSSSWHDVQSLCRAMFNRHLPQAMRFRSPRAVAYTLTALCKLNKPLSRENLHQVKQLSSFLVNLYKQNRKRSWHWFEDIIAYSNGILPQSLLCVYARTGDKSALKTAHDTLNFLCDILFRNGYLNIIGNQGWMVRGKKPACYDQQPVDAASIAFACLEAYQSIGGQHYLDLAHRAHRWFHGENIHGLSLYDETTGGCFDALTPAGVNLNQGAESLLAYLLCEQHAAKYVQKDQPAALEQSS
ncbi:MAG TPA: hypothetical protein PLS54_09720 [Syntrophomonadaceae bacterium]|nr:hypothetical protein [Syntrophomonadaceae bacterium]